MLLLEAIQNFTIHLISRERSSETVRGYSMTLEDFRKFIENKLNGAVYVDEIKLDHYEWYLSYRRDRGDQIVSRNRALYILRSFGKFLLLRDLVEKDYSQRLEPLNEPKKERVSLTLEELEALLKAIRHPLVRVAARTMGYTGLRVSELCNLKLDDVDVVAGLIQVIEGKGKKNRIVPINPTLLEDLKTYLASERPNVKSQYFFATQKTGRLSPYYINKHLKEATDALGWDKHITAHILRHSFASALVAKNAPLASIQKLLGHSDLRVTSVYIHQNVEQLQEAVNLIGGEVHE